MEKYDSYRSTRFPWYNDIPAHWNTCAMSRILAGIQDGTHGSFERKSSGFPLLSAKNINESGIVITESESLIDESDFQSIVANGFPQKGDIAFCSVGSIGKCCIYDLNETNAFQRSVTFLRIKQNVDSKYILYFLRSTSATAQYAALLKKSAIGGIYMGDIRRIQVLLPPHLEQKAIANYLDRETRMIDAFIAAKEKEFALLDELKQAEIANAVTHGLNPDAPMKSSGISWLGDIPAHWEVKRYGALFKLKKFKVHNPEDELLSVFLDRGVIRACESDKRTHNPSEDLSKYQLVEPTDFVMNNQQAWRGSVGVSFLRGIISPAYHIFNLPDCLDAKFANFMLRDKTMVSQFEISSRGVGSIQRTLNFNWLNSSKVIIPPLEEQLQIVSYIEEKIEKISSLKFAIACEIDHLKEYKQRLIADAVTGQIKVC